MTTPKTWKPLKLVHMLHLCMFIIIRYMLAWIILMGSRRCQWHISA